MLTILQHGFTAIGMIVIMCLGVVILYRITTRPPPMQPDSDFERSMEYWAEVQERRGQ